MRKIIYTFLLAALFSITAHADGLSTSPGQRLHQGGIVLPVQGGTGQRSYTDGQLLIGNSTTGGLGKATLTAGSGITVTNGHGTITIASSGAASELVLLATATASSSASLDFTSDITSSYDYYIFVIKNLIQGTNSITELKASADNGSTWTAGLNWQTALTLVGTSTSPTLAGGTNPAQLSGANSVTALSGVLTLTAPNITGTQYTSMRGTIMTSGGNMYENYISTNSGSSINAIRFLPASGTYTSGTILMYGVKNT